MDTKLEKVSHEQMKKILVDTETLRLLEKLIGIDGCCYDWWELSQGIKDLAVGLTLIKGSR